MQPKPVEQPKNRPMRERLSFDDNSIVMQDFANNYIEFQFEELRLKDYRAKFYDQQLITLEQDFKSKNPLDRAKIAARVVNSPTINTKIAFEELEPFLKGTPNFAKSLINKPDGKFEPTVNFDALKLSLVDVERRNEERGVAFEDEV
ncbi:Conserved_hypothetical protein [Hexamita inflata]|uniref:Uncharacterized protein n=1 Tax=Hexamita inflata TaxID=28002 RepID=A0AA86RAD4_9EUKA|nr:Conserved hypothetical protein [Hexamita inflata]